MSVPLADRLRAACVGHPAASIVWPHRLLHEAAHAIEAAHVALSLVKDAMPQDALHAYTVWEIPHSTFIKCGEARGLLEAASTQTSSWPLRCLHPNSCASHQACMYVGCVYRGQEISAA